MQGLVLVDGRKRRTKLTLREEILDTFKALRVRLDQAEKRILASLDGADPKDAA